MSSSFGLNAGVHRKTNVYIEPSNNDCIAPSNAIFSSEDPADNVRMISYVYLVLCSLMRWVKHT